MSDCNHDCSSCSQKCSEEEQEKYIKTNELSNIKKVIAVVSGKGGVGKSLTTAMLAVLMKRRGHKVAVLDADITGPSIPKAFGLTEKAMGSELGIFPVMTKMGIETISINNFLENETDPVLWRGSIISNSVKQFYTDVLWNDVDFMFVDMPPGTGDVSLTVFQSIKIDGIIVVTSPQELVSMIVEKAVKMADMMNIPVLGIVENMSYYKCPTCNKEHSIFGESHIEEVAKLHNVQTVSKLPIDSEFSKLVDRGLIELFEGDFLDNLCDYLEV